MHNNKPEMRSMETVGGGSVTFMSLLILFPDLSFNALVVGIRDYSTAMRLSGSSLRHQTFFFFQFIIEPGTEPLFFYSHRKPSSRSTVAY